MSLIEGKQKKGVIKWIIKRNVFTIIQSDVNMSKPQQNLLSVLSKGRMEDITFRAVLHP